MTFPNNYLSQQFFEKNAFLVPCKIERVDLATSTYRTSTRSISTYYCVTILANLLLVKLLHHKSVHYVQRSQREFPFKLPPDLWEFLLIDKYYHHQASNQASLCDIVRTIDILKVRTFSPLLSQMTG